MPQQNWIQTVVQAHKDSESPERFFYWSALTTMSAIIKKQVWVDRHFFTTYPNLFVFLIAGSGMKKSIPIDLSRNLVDLAGGVRVISGRNSVQKILEDLSKAYSIEGGGVIKNAQGYIINGELSAFLVKDPDALSVLTDVYDTHSYDKKNWKYNLRSGEFTLKEPCITWLGATNEEHFDDCIPPVQIKGGFIRRVLIVHSLIPGKYNSLVYKPTSIVNLDLLVPFLKKLRHVNGPMEWSKDGGEFYHDWYHTYSHEEHFDQTGSSKTITEQVVKVAMLIALAHDYDKVLRIEYLKEAKSQCLECLGGTNKVTMSSGKGTLTDLNKIAFRMLLLAPNNQVSRKTLARRFWNEGYSSGEMDMVITMLLESSVISISEGKDPMYIMKKAVVEQYKEVAS